jgi:hypothetical protein
LPDHWVSQHFRHGHVLHDEHSSLAGTLARKRNRQMSTIWRE